METRYEYVGIIEPQSAFMAAKTLANFESC